MVRCEGCERKCKKVAINDCTFEEMLQEVREHDCSYPEKKNFKHYTGKIRKMVCRPRVY